MFNMNTIDDSYLDRYDVCDDDYTAEEIESMIIETGANVDVEPLEITEDCPF